MAQKPKVFLITDNFPFGKGEASFILPELPFLMERFDVTIISKNDSDAQTSQVDPSIRVYRYPRQSRVKKLLYCLKGLFDTDIHEELREIRKNKIDKRASTVASFYSYAEACCFWQWLKKEVLVQEIPDLFYTYWNNYAAYALAKNKGHLHGAKLVTRMHGYDLFNERVPGGRQALKKQTDRKLDCAVFVSARAKEYYIKHFATKQNSQKYPLFHLGVPGRGKSPYSPSKTLRIFSCSNLVALKRVDLLIKGLALIDNIDISWIHVGGGTQEQEIHALAQSLLSGKANISYSLLGDMQNPKVVELLQATEFDCFISVTSTEGGVPVSMMEACSFGVPIISTDAGGTSEIVSNKNGMLLDVTITAADLAQALQAFYQLEKNQKQAMRQNAYTLWQQNFNSDRNFAVFTQHLFDLIIND
ncbi:glycosyltransferase [Christensenellaceae bacterium OttesenSCG-928-K19]|nr:glycosyltransferase [Christensenellaceae bacterium OttesenSCG-928-K19]